MDIEKFICGADNSSSDNNEISFQFEPILIPSPRLASPYFSPKMNKTNHSSSDIDCELGKSRYSSDYKTSSSDIKPSTTMSQAYYFDDNYSNFNDSGESKK